MCPRVAPDPGNGRLVMCAPDEVDRLARDLAWSGEHVFPLGPVSAGERSVERTEDSGP
jgi:hypothetical protein